MGKRAEIITGCSLYVDGVGFIANTATVELPKIEFESYESKSGVSTHKVQTSVLKAMEAKFEINEVNAIYFAAMGARLDVPAVIWVKTTSIIDKKERKIVATLKGFVQDFEFPKPEIGKEAKSSFTMCVDFFSYIQDAVPLVTIDVDNMVCQIGATDVWSTQREHLL